jgi:pilus assembly protein CpaE
MSKSDSLLAASSWKFLLICPSTAITKEIHQSLATVMPAAQLLEIPLYPPSAGLLEVCSSQNPDICFVDVVSDRNRGLNLIRELGISQPKTPMIAILPPDDTDLILQCLRSGAAEFLNFPPFPGQMEEILARLVAKNPLMRGSNKSGRVIAVVPAKGACGSSTIASGLTLFWKNRSGNTLLADLDPLTGTISFLLKVKSQYSFMDIVALSNDLDDDLWRSIITSTQGIDVLLSPDETVQGIHDLVSASDIIDYARQHYQTSIIDCSSPYGPWNLSILQRADEILLVSTNELPSLQATQRAISYLDQNNIDRSKIKLLINRYNRDVGLGKEVIETAIRFEVFHLLPSDFEAVQRAMIEGKPSPANSPFGKSLIQLAEKLGGYNQALAKPAKPAKSTPAWGGLFGLFRGSR